ncbi:winged helix-turn-helix transcriptional regulator [Dyadobacter diqingensis]|uniref:winged helix-turn-helix transcriptional regulator n=1 Tax=Dyadobacter diqingensis TaxID=2938121 RepID=UPI0020C19B16|nr:helix-turn-helix domain-containing protein [Dyadobacter diqingensis]
MEPLEKELINACKIDYQAERNEMTLGIRDALDIIDGKWKILIIGTLSFRGKKRFMELLREVDGIAAKMLSKELQELEINKLIKRTVCDTKPITVEYEITPYGKTLDKAIIEIMKWGVEHRRTIMYQD